MAPQDKQLRMIWPERLLSSPPRPQVPEGYLLRCYRDADEAGYLELMTKAGFERWNHERVAAIVQKVLPDGFFVIVHRASGKIVATAMTTHNPIDLHPYGGELGWVAAAPEHRGKGLGLAVCAQATARLIQAGYRNIYLLTDDFRLPAIKTYLKLGYEPLLFCEGMAERWEQVYRKLGLEVPKGGFARPAVRQLPDSPASF